MCVCVGGGGGGDYNFVYFFYIFLSFGMILALNHVNFHFPTMFFFLQLYSISGNASYDK